MAVTAQSSEIIADYKRQFFESEQLFHRACNVLAGGVPHDSWRFSPFPVSMEKASGPFKWDVSGMRFCDYWMGHGALLMGHSFPPVVEAVKKQMERGSHFGGAHELQIEWAERVCSMIPSAEQVRFTSSGTEATMLAMRTARAFTQRHKIVKLDGHFHGWHDEALSHYVPVDSTGLNPGVPDYMLVTHPLSLEDIVELLETEGREIAAVILEPGGGSSGGLPWDHDFLAALRDATSAQGTVLIYDEVVSGFRYAPGGVQGLCGVLPDMTVLAKILAGGLPGGAIAGRADIMSVFGKGCIISEPQSGEQNNRQVRVPHTGTFNANPLSAAAGIALLDQIRDGLPQKQAEAATALLVGTVNDYARLEGVDVRLYAQSSTFHILIGAVAAELPLEPSTAVVTLHSAHPERYELLRRVLLLEGVDSHPIHGWVSAAHEAHCIEETAGAFRRAFRRLRQESGFAV